MPLCLALALTLSAGDALTTAAWSPEEGCVALASDGPSRNEHYLAPPAHGADYEAWLAALRRWREIVRADRDAGSHGPIALTFDGVRAWLRLSRPVAWAADLQPGETVTVTGEARWLQGGDRLCLAFDYVDRTGPDAPWRGWSTVVASTNLTHSEAWHRFEVSAPVPQFDHGRHWARPILGMDGTFDTAQAKLQLRGLTLSVPAEPVRAARWPAAAPTPLDLRLYDRPDLAWTSSNFVCGFQMMVDRAFWDPTTESYRVDTLCDVAEREFGGWDSVVLWHAYPRIGVDDRNQFDFWRHMPGGLAGLREVVDGFHRRGVKVFIPYKPWDQGTRREGRPDEVVLADIVAAIDADGIFLDTMVQAPTALRTTIDAARAGVTFEPEGHPRVEEIAVCGSSWAQWLTEWPGVGVLSHKWIEPRHMQHQIRRWDTEHRRELAAAWLNGSGIMVWENVFGTWNPWPAADRADLRRMAPILRHYAPLLTGGEWLPCYPAGDALASVWRQPGRCLITLASPDGHAGSATLVLRDDGERWFDLWSGQEISPQRADGQVTLRVTVDRFGALAAVHDVDDGLTALLAHSASLHRPNAAHALARPVIEPLPPPTVTRPLPADGMLRLPAGSRTFAVEHQRRECGCYPDPGTPPERWHEFLVGSPWDGRLMHRVTADVAPGQIDAEPVTNALFARFLAESGWRPARAERFLAHWGGPTCPDALACSPVVYVDLDDARAYAAWVGRRLPTEWEWQAAAEMPGFARGKVWEWTESERDDGHTRFVMLRGGSEYVPTGSGWYFPSGPQPVTSHAKFLRLWPGLDRCATVGFRCVRPD